MRIQLESQAKALDQLIGNTRVLEGKLAEAKSKKDTLKARAASAKTSKQIQEMMGSLNTSNASVAFDKLEEKARRPRGGGAGGVGGAGLWRCLAAFVRMPCWGCGRAAWQHSVRVLHPGRPASSCCSRGPVALLSTSLPTHPQPPHFPTPAPAPQVIAMEAQSEAVGMLVAGDGVEAKFAALEGGAVDDELAALKSGLLTGSKQPVAALPQGKPVMDAIDEELDALRKKARE
jgi:hypothetical protein